MRIGTRASKLARLQTQLVVDKISVACPDQATEIVPVTTGGDKVVDRPIAEIGTRGVFVKELEEALLRGDADLVVHSLKDMPTDVPAGLHLAAILERRDPRDVLVIRESLKQQGVRTFNDLKAGSTIATSSRRRAAQLSSRRPDLKFIDIRGNIDTRLRKLDEGYCDATILAAAGLVRLGWQERIDHYFAVDELTPAAGQGALAVECRSGDQKLIDILGKIDDPIARAEAECERAFLDCLGGGCSVPIGALARIELESGQPVESARLVLHGCVAALDGSQVYRMSLTASASDPPALGRRLAESIMSCGARAVVEQLRLSIPAQISPP